MAGREGGGLDGGLSYNTSSGSMKQLGEGSA